MSGWTAALWLPALCAVVGVFCLFMACAQIAQASFEYLRRVRARKFHRKD